MRTWNVSWIPSMFERGRGRLVGAEREWYSNGSKISAAFEESEKNHSNISIEDICSIEESAIISPMMNVCQCLTFRNNHRGANPSNVQINYVWALPEENIGVLWSYSIRRKTEGADRYLKLLWLGVVPQNCHSTKQKASSVNKHHESFLCCSSKPWSACPGRDRKQTEQGNQIMGYAIHSLHFVCFAHFTWLFKADVSS